MKKTILFLAMIVFGITSVQAQQTTKAGKSGIIVLVHGAWSDASAWDAVTPLLKAQQYQVIVVSLPGHGKDQTSFADIKLQTYVDVVKAAIGENNNIVLVGHSMAGVVISEVAEQIPSQIKKLVYLAAYLPHTGESLLSLSTKDAGSHLGKNLIIDQEHGRGIIKKELVTDVFVADAPKKVADYVVANFRTDEPLAPFADKVTLTDKNFGSIKKAYIFTTEDHAVSYPYQLEMVKGSKVANTYTLTTSHTPFISAPSELAKIILKEAK
ncbi:alpha/beta hydrolase [Dyadobacter subterraneus]|uniref:Alpha/beta hydrolase n=1 Tax=Dyadobacter subterraneus TaxID=2773304 RepID=A0ABR9W9V5_9BACT|nr:alpha/beta hydrolase [Dyadobacter subterraneus]MBE9461919.1 alpha/beta hydrolase [Dyadobacter subterraneus]